MHNYVAFSRRFFTEGDGRSAYAWAYHTEKRTRCRLFVFDFFKHSLLVLHFRVELHLPVVPSHLSFECCISIVLNVHFAVIFQILFMQFVKTTFTYCSSLRKECHYKRHYGNFSTTAPKVQCKSGCYMTQINWGRCIGPDVFTTCIKKKVVKWSENV